MYANGSGAGAGASYAGAGAGVAVGEAMVVPSKAGKDQKTVRTLLICALALLAIGIFLMGLSKIGSGLSYYPTTRMTGFGFIYNFAAMHVFFVGAGLVFSSMVMGVAAAIKSRATPPPDEAPVRPDLVVADN